MACQYASRLRDGRPIGVEAEQATIRRRGLQEPIGVPTAADRAVDHGAARSQVEGGENLVDHDRQVPFSHVVLHLSLSAAGRPARRRMIGRAVA